MAWTDDRVATLTKLWADGLSASQIANELGGVTRNAVIGKVHRLGLSGRARSGNSTPRAKRATPRASTYTKSNKSASRASGNTNIKLNSVSIPRPESVPDVVAPDPLKLSLIELSESTCKWPIGDPSTTDFYFCGHKSKDDCPYCEFHSMLAYQPQAERRTKRASR